MPTDKYEWKMRNNSVAKREIKSPPKMPFTRASATKTLTYNDVTPRTGNNTNRTKQSITETIKKNKMDGKKSK